MSGSSRDLSRTKDLESHYSRLQGLEPISVVTACRRVGMFFDLWKHDPVRLISLLEIESRSCTHPLRGLFIPGETRDENQPCRRESGKFSLKEGSRVKARFANEFTDHSGELYVDHSQIWHNAIIQADNRDGTFTVKPENDPEGREFGKSIEDLVPFYTEEDDDGERYFLQAFGCAKAMTWKSFFSLLLITLFIAFAPELAFDSGEHKKNIDYCLQKSSGSHIVDTICSFLTSLPEVEAGLGMKVSLFSLAFCGFLGLVLPACYKSLSLCCPVAAKTCRRLYVNVILDPIRVGALACVYGREENVLAWLAASAFLSTLCCAVLLLRVGLVPLGIVAVRSMLTFLNIVLGEDVGVQQVRMSRLLAILLEHAEQANIDMREAALRAELEMLVSRPFNSGTVDLSLPFITLIASLMNVVNADSRRLRSILVRKAYAEFKHLPKSLPELERRYDVIVDVFAGTCKVPGIHHELGRWHKTGNPIPWHFAVCEEAVVLLEKDLERLHVPPGAGCFTWRSTRTGLWQKPESTNIQCILKASKHLAMKQRRRDQMLHDLAINDSLDDDPEAAQAFLRAGADPNFQVTAGQSSLYRACANGKEETAKLLIEFKGDVNQITNRESTVIHHRNAKSVHVENALMQYIKDAGLEVV